MYGRKFLVLDDSNTNLDVKNQRYKDPYFREMLKLQRKKLSFHLFFENSVVVFRLLYKKNVKQVLNPL